MARPAAPFVRTPDARFADLPGHPSRPGWIDDLPSLDGLRMAVIDEGPRDAPRTWLCLHGNPAWSYLYRRMIPAFLAAGDRVVAPDLPGFGRSDKPLDDAWHTFSRHRAVLLELVGRLDLHEVNLVVQDWGGLIGLTLPMVEPARWRGLLAMNTLLATGEAPLPEGFRQWRAMCRAKPDFSISRLTRAVDVITDPVTGLPACRSAVDGTDPNCVPYNPYVLGGIGQDALDYLQVPLLQNGTTEQAVVIASITGDLGQYGFKLPSADTGLQVAGGFEYRRDAITQIVDNSFATGDGAGQGGPTLPLSGEIDVYDLFAEFQMPLVSGAPGIDLLAIDGAARVSDYSTGISAESWKVGAEYAPT